MLVRQPVITNQRVGDRRMSACELMDARFEKYSTTFHATRVLFELHIFHPDTITRSKIVSSRTHLHYPSQKRWLPGDSWETGNHRAEPVSVLRRAPTVTDEQHQQRVGSRALSPSELWTAERGGETPGKLRIQTFSWSSPSCPRESPTQFSLRSNHAWEHQRPLYLAPRSANQDVPLDDG